MPLSNKQTNKQTSWIVRCDRGLGKVICILGIYLQPSACSKVMVNCRERHDGWSTRGARCSSASLSRIPPYAGRRMACVGPRTIRLFRSPVMVFQYPFCGLTDPSRIRWCGGGTRAHLPMVPPDTCLWDDEFAHRVSLLEGLPAFLVALQHSHACHVVDWCRHLGLLWTKTRKTSSRVFEKKTKICNETIWTANCAQWVVVQ